MSVPVLMPKKGNTVDECLLVEWLVTAGDSVRAGDVLCVIETDKASFEVEAPVAGTILRILAQAGDIVPVLTAIAFIGAGDEESAPEKGTEAPGPCLDARANAPWENTPGTAIEPDTAEADVVEEVAVSETIAPVVASPRARRYAERFGLDMSAVHGSGPEGRILYRDIVAALDSGAIAKTSRPALDLLADGGVRPKHGGGIGGLVRARDIVRDSGPPEAAEMSEAVPYQGIRKLIGERMRSSLAGHAQLTLNSSADATALLNMRRRFKEAARDGNATGLTDMVCWITAKVLAAHPEVNALFDAEAGTIVRHARVHLGVAVDTPRGLMVPVVRDADTLSLDELSRIIARYSEQCRTGSIDPDVLSGGTFTVTNLGGFGVESFTPILNTPQVAILGVCAIVHRPAILEDRLAMQPRIGLSLTIDHQAVDGAPGARFLQEIAEGLETMDERVGESNM